MKEKTELEKLDHDIERYIRQLDRYNGKLNRVLEQGKKYLDRKNMDGLHQWLALMKNNDVLCDELKELRQFEHTFETLEARFHTINESISNHH